MAKILIAEDEQDIRDLIKFTLNFAGHEVVATSNGEEALTKALEAKPDLILMDVRMPRMTGYEACRRMKMQPSLANVPVVFLSAKGQESEVRAGLDAGAEEYLLKPFAPVQLTETISRLLAKHAAQPAPPEQPPAQPTPPSPAEKVSYPWQQTQEPQSPEPEATSPSQQPPQQPTRRPLTPPSMQPKDEPERKPWEPPSEFRRR